MTTTEPPALALADLRTIVTDGSELAKGTGIVDQVDATRIVIRATEEVDPSKPGVDIMTSTRPVAGSMATNTERSETQHELHHGGRGS